MAAATSSFYSDFVPVNRKKRKSRAPREKEPLSDIMQRLRDELGQQQDDWLTQCQQILTESFAAHAFPEEVLCLGLGSPSASHNSRAQLAFLLAISQYLRIAPEKVSLYDPVFTAEDSALFGTFHLNVLSEDKDAEYTLDRPTLCFMPHCDMDLYENIIKTNWSQRRIPYLLLVANRLMDYIDSNPRHKLETRVPFILTLAPKLQCRPFPPSLQWPTAFNNTAVQVFSGGEIHTNALGMPEVINKQLSDNTPERSIGGSGAADEEIT